MTVPEEQDPLLNTLLGGARIQRRVSAGLLAHVYLGHYERLNVPVAVKVLTPKATSQGMNKERFVREGRALAQLSHQNIIKIYNVGHENGRFFIVMDWIQDGMNLRQLAQSRPLTPGQSLKVIRRLSEALEYIHQKNLIHRDVKPANICLRKGGHPVIMDFSLIKDQSSDVQLTAPGTIMGTVNFMPPEQAQPGGPFGNVGPWSDVYSLGGTLYWLLTGKPPFKGRTPMETIIKLIREPHVPASQINPTIPPEVDALVARCLAKKSEERYQSAQQLMAALDEVMATCAEALKNGQPPAPAEDDSAPGAPAAAPASGTVPAAAAPPTGTAGPTRGWGTSGSFASSSGSGSGRLPSSGVQPAIAPAPTPAVPAAVAAQPAAAARGTNRLAPPPQGDWVAAPLEAGAAPRGSTRLAPSPPHQAAPAPAAPPPAPADQWQQANGMDQPADDAQTVRIGNQARGPGAPAAAPPAAQRASGDRVLPKPAPPPAAAKPANPLAAVPPTAPPANPLTRSWVEDAPAAPSWTEQTKEPGASTLGMTAPASVETPGTASAETSAEEEKPAGKAKVTAERAVAKPNAKGKRGKLELVIVIGAVVVLLSCAAALLYVFVLSKPAGGGP